MLSKWPLTHRLTAASAAGFALLTLGTPGANAAPSNDARGYLDSTARCASADDTVVFGSTATSRVAICGLSGGKYEYRGVRLRDGAKLVVPATRSDDGAFVAKNDGVEYLLTAKSLVLSVGERVLREEPMLDFHGPDAPKASPSPTPSKPLPPPLAAEVGGGGA
ncbi:hypothetical protein M1247_01825 [Mycobacterium sp. 21AC1]|uniref:hypothetical protein n=1 Tax=[Mycobacterium] appelbergii TaxID=2939269 RepID=UPI00293948D3|nr:hypothetical protein [Mycobacterium sp. 21AC1]MDV3123642.1 hypothetical protein [Mycobacterium sp. 21AC1]